MCDERHGYALLGSKQSWSAWRRNDRICVDVIATVVPATDRNHVACSGSNACVCAEGHNSVLLGRQSIWSNGSRQWCCEVFDSSNDCWCVQRGSRVLWLWEHWFCDIRWCGAMLGRQHERRVGIGHISCQHYLHAHKCEHAGRRVHCACVSGF